MASLTHTPVCVGFPSVGLLQCCLPFLSYPHNSWFCSINMTHYAAVAGGYYGWSTPYNYLDAYQMQLDTNVLVNGTCLASNDTYDMVVCPSGTFKLPESQIKGLCGQRGLPCPVVSHTTLLPSLLLLLLLPMLLLPLLLLLIVMMITQMCSVTVCHNVFMQQHQVGQVVQQLLHALQLTRVWVSSLPEQKHACFEQRH